MDVQGTILFLLISCTAQSTELLFQGDGIQAQAPTMGPLGKDATLSLLVQDMLDLKSQVKNQEQEIQTLKGHQTLSNNFTTSSLNQLMSEIVDIKSSFGTIKQEFDQTNNLTGLQTITKRLDKMAQSIRYLTMSHHVHEIHIDEINQTVYQEFGALNTAMTILKRDQDFTNKTLMNEILNLANLEKLHRLDISTLSTSISKSGSDLQPQLRGIFMFDINKQLLNEN